MAKSLVNQRIKWDTAPTVVLYKKGPARFEAADSYSISGAAEIGAVDQNDCLKHTTKILPKLRDQYRDAGFATRVILQDPRSHRGPTTACTIGFPTNLPRKLWSERLRLYKRFVCRVHVDIITAKDGYLWSKPHVEPDPVFHWKEHLEYSTVKHLDIRGPPAVRILRYFLDL